MSDQETKQESGEAASADDESRKAGLISWLTALPERFGLRGSRSLRDKLENALKEEGTGPGAFSNEEREMLLRLLRFGASRVDDIMVPRADITAIEEGEQLRELVLLFEKAGVSRIPVFHETLDDPRGMVHIKDLFRWLTAEAAGRSPEAADGNGAKALAKPEVAQLDLTRPISAARIRRPVLYVPPSMPAMNLLIKMQSSRIHMALVVDEYGGTDGLVTIEDLVEQIVGDIEDEHDEREDSLIYVDPKQGLVASARASIDEVEAHLGVKLLKAGEEEEIDTLGGLVFALVGRVPARGEVVRHVSGVEFEVLDADPRRVKKLKIHRPKAPSALPGGPPAAPAAS